MDLILDELKTTLEQEITPTLNASVMHIRPHLYIENNPSGSVKVQVLSEGVVIAESSEVSISSITSATYAHGYIRFDVDVFLKENVTYKLRLAPGTGYSFSGSAFVGWCKDFDLRKYATAYSASSGLRSAYDYEVWGRETVRKGLYS